MGEQKHIPAQVFCPGELMADEMEARGWTVEHVAKRMRIEPSLVKALLKAETRVTTRLAIALWRCFGISIEFWEATERVYREWPDRQSVPPGGAYIDLSVMRPWAAGSAGEPTQE